MLGSNHVDASSSGLARRALLITSLISVVGSGLGLFGIARGVVAGLAIPLVLSCFLFTSVTLIMLLRSSRVPLQAIATASTIYFIGYLSVGSIVSIYGNPHQRLNLFIFLIWFFPLLVFNKLVNAPTTGRYLAKSILVAPIAILAFSLARLNVTFKIEESFVLVSFCIGFLGFALMIDVVSRYREDFVAQRERAESLKVEAAVLESISDCFISLDARQRLVYLNDAACVEFGVSPGSALGKTIFDAVTDFFSQEMVDSLQAAFGAATATAFEAPDEHGDRWYEMRCFPQQAGLSVYFRNVSDRRATASKIEHLAFYDVLTGLPNRVLLRRQLETALENATRQGRFGAVLFIDLDDFKTLNDTLGHDVGDHLLEGVAQRLTSCVGPHSVARVGGDEFLIVVENLDPDLQVARKNATALAQTILIAFAAPYRIGTIEQVSTAAIGIALFSGRPDTVDELLKCADLAMYRAKASGQNSMCFFDPEMQTSVASRAELVSNLRVALPNREFALYFQPLIDCNDCVTGAEALLRWKHPGRGMVPPDQFIPLAEDSGLIVELGRWVLEVACRQLARWAQHSETQGLTLAVNVSLRQFFDISFVAVVLDVLRETGANPQRLKLELTESSAMENVEETIAKLTALRAHGIAISIDDFGTGYSSLSHLKRLPLDQLKIDRSFVNDIVTDCKVAAIVRTLIALARDLKLSVIAEGVETQDQRRLLEREGCYHYQGYLYSPALPIADFERFVAASRARIQVARSA